MRASLKTTHFTQGNLYETQSIIAVWHYGDSPCSIRRSDIRFIKCAVCNTCYADDLRCKTEHGE